MYLLHACNQTSKTGTNPKVQEAIDGWLESSVDISTISAQDSRLIKRFTKPI